MNEVRCAISVRLSFRRDGQDRAVGRPQVFARRLLNQLRRDLAELVLEPVDLRRVVVEQREGGEQVGAAEADELLVVGVEPRAALDERQLELLLGDRRVLQPRDLLVDRLR